MPRARLGFSSRYSKYAAECTPDLTSTYVRNIATSALGCGGTWRGTHIRDEHLRRSASPAWGLHVRKAASGQIRSCAAYLCLSARLDFGNRGPAELFASGFPFAAQINTQLLAFLVQVAALETQRLGRVGDVVSMLAEFRQDRLAFEFIDAFGESARTAGCVSAGGRRGVVRQRQ